MSTTPPKTPDITSAQSCEESARSDLYVGTVLGVVSAFNAELAALNIRPEITTPIAVLTGVASLPFIHNSMGNSWLAKKHRAGIKVPG